MAYIICRTLRVGHLHYNIIMDTKKYGLLFFTKKSLCLHKKMLTQLAAKIQWNRSEREKRSTIFLTSLQGLFARIKKHKKLPVMPAFVGFHKSIGWYIGSADRFPKMKIDQTGFDRSIDIRMIRGHISSRSITILNE